MHDFCVPGGRYTIWPSRLFNRFSDLQYRFAYVSPGSLPFLDGEVLPIEVQEVSVWANEVMNDRMVNKVILLVVRDLDPLIEVDAKGPRDGFHLTGLWKIEK